MKATIKDNILYIEIPMETPRESSTGKSLIVASTGGFEKTPLQVEGKQLTINLTAMVKK